MSDAVVALDDTLVERCRRVHPWLVVIVIIVTVMTLLGWATGNPLLKSVAPGLTTMKVNTALGLLLGGLAILARRLPGNWRRIGNLCAAVVAVLGLLSLVEYLTGADLRIDNLFVIDRGTPVFPGRMAPATAATLLSFAIGIYLLNHQRTRLAAQVVLIATILPHWASLCGYVLGTPGMYFHVPYPAVALHTAICAMLLCVAGLLEYPDQDLMRVLTNSLLAGGVARKLLPMGALLPLLVGVAVVTGEVRGWYTQRFGFALLTTCCAILFIAASWWTSWLLLERETADTAHRRKVETELLDAKDTAEAASRAKDQFLAVLSHELRTPLTPVLAAIELMERDPALVGDTHETVEMIRRNIQLEARLIDDLLDLTRIARGKIKLHHEAADVHAAVTRTIETWQTEIDGKHLKIELSLCAGGPTVWADPTRFQQVLWNLLGNAIKFTPPRGQISISTADEGDDQISIKISDTGAGIEPDILPRLFNAFEQGEATISRRFGGLGLGLSISKALLEMHGGTITAASAGKDQGATFTVLMKAMKGCEPAPARSESASPTTAAPANLSVAPRRRILLVEDNNDTLKIMNLLLKKLGFEVVTATCVKAALELGNNQHFDLLVSDIGLPDGSGWDIIKALKQTQKIRGVAISGFGMEEDLQRSKDAGFEQHLVKPVSFEVLRDTVREVAETEAPSSV